MSRLKPERVKPRFVKREGVAGAAEEVTDREVEGMTTGVEEGVGIMSVDGILVDVGTTIGMEGVVGSTGAGGVEMAGGGMFAVVGVARVMDDLVVAGATIEELGVTTTDRVGMGRNFGFRRGA